MPINQVIRAPITKSMTCNLPAFFSASILSLVISSTVFCFVSLLVCFATAVIFGFGGGKVIFPL